MSLSRSWFQPDLDASHASMPRPEYPRPDFQRGAVEGFDWLNINGVWAFEFDPEDRGEHEGWYTYGRAFSQTITVPFPWESHLAWDEGRLASNDNWFSRRAFLDPDGVDPANYQKQPRHEIGWYRHTVTIPAHWGDRHIILHFGAVDWAAKVWVNEQPIGMHVGGYTPFWFDITDACEPGEPALIVVRVYDPNDHSVLPGGKQINWYARTSGIWQTVFLEPRPSSYISRVHITPDVDRARASIRMHTEGKTPHSRLRITISGPDGRVFTREAPAGEETLQDIDIPDPLLWEPDAPHIYEAVAELLSGATPVDRVRTSFGMRKVSVDTLPDTSTRYIFLNNRPVYLLGALNQSFNPWGVYTFPSDEAIQEDLRRAKAFGFNFLRIHIKVEDPRFLYWADRLGVLLMCDMPNFDSSGYGIDAQMHWETLLRETIERDFNHPSIIAWCCFNETWGLGGEAYKTLKDRQKWVRSCYHTARSLDPTRLVEDNSPCLYDHVETQINSWHFYINDYEKARDHIAHVVSQTYPGSSFNYTEGNTQGGEPLMNSEYGGISARMGDRDISWCFKFLTNELRLHEKICGYVYTELQDIEWEHNGFMDYDRTVKTFGYDYRMINAPDVVLLDGPPARVLPGGAVFEIDVATSHFSARTITDATLRWRLDAVDCWGKAHAWLRQGRATIPFTPYRVERVHRISLTLPAGNQVCTLHVWVEDAYGQVIARNFTVIKIHDGPLPSVDFQQDYLALRYDPHAFVSGEWSGGVIAEGDMMTGLGAGAFEYRLDLPDGMDLDTVEAIELWSELSAGREDAPQTGPRRHPSDVMLSVNGEPFGTLQLPDAPADARGVLSYLHGIPGRYGELVHAVATENDLAQILAGITDNQLTVRYEVAPYTEYPNGLALFGARAGRYPVGPCLVLRFKQG